MKNETIERKLSEHERCIREKDQRITKLEKRWNKIIEGLMVSSSVICVVLYIGGCFVFNFYLGDLLFNLVSETELSTITIVLLAFEAVGLIALVSGFFMLEDYLKK